VQSDQSIKPRDKCVVLLSGGMDSATVLALAKQHFKEVHTLSIFYGQTHKRELAAAEWLQHKFESASHARFEIPLKGLIHKSTLFGREAAEPEKPQIAPSWLPARNAIFFSVAAGYAHSINAWNIGTGINAIDWSGYPDCTPQFAVQIEYALRFALDNENFKLYKPIINFTKAQIVREGQKLGVPWEYTCSCYSGGDYPCETCGACIVRAKGFADAKVEDPLIRAKRFVQSAGGTVITNREPEEHE
jgi:7-cyano-7-deazaguanine synthase